MQCIWHVNFRQLRVIVSRCVDTYRVLRWHHTLIFYYNHPKHSRHARTHVTLWPELFSKLVLPTTTQTSLCSVHHNLDIPLEIAIFHHSLPLYCGVVGCSLQHCDWLVASPHSDDVDADGIVNSLWTPLYLDGGARRSQLSDFSTALANDSWHAVFKRLSVLLFFFACKLNWLLHLNAGFESSPDHAVYWMLCRVFVTDLQNSASFAAYYKSHQLSNYVLRNPSIPPGALFIAAQLKLKISRWKKLISFFLAHQTLRELCIDKEQLLSCHHKHMKPIPTCLSTLSNSSLPPLNQPV